MKKYMTCLLALLLVVNLCAGALAEPGIHPYQMGAPDWVKEIADKGGPKSFPTQVKEKYGEAEGEALLESLGLQKGSAEGVEKPRVLTELERLLASLGNPEILDFNDWFDLNGNSTGTYSYLPGSTFYFTVQGYYIRCDTGTIGVNANDTLAALLSNTVPPFAEIIYRP